MLITLAAGGADAAGASARQTRALRSHLCPARQRGLFSTPFTLHPGPYTLHPTPHTLHPPPYTLHPTPYTLHPTPYTLHLTPYTLHPTPCTRHSTPCPLTYCRNGLGAESMSGQETRNVCKEIDIYAIVGISLSQNSIPHP